MDTLKQLRDELQTEYQITRKFFERYPDDKNDYSPHEKSMKLLPLATHIAEIFGWGKYILETSELDYAKNMMPAKEIATGQDLLEVLDENLMMSIQSLENAQEDELNLNWALKNNGEEMASWTKYGAIRHGLSQIIHHRAQMGVYYRLNDIPLPGTNGPSADENNF